MWLGKKVVVWLLELSIILHSVNIFLIKEILRDLKANIYGDIESQKIYSPYTINIISYEICSTSILGNARQLRPMMLALH